MSIDLKFVELTADVLDTLFIKSYLSFFLFSSDTSLHARTVIRNVRGGGHNSTVGVTLPEVWARSVRSVARGKPLKFFWPWA